jgi:hypothetical protein
MKRSGRRRWRQFVSAGEHLSRAAVTYHFYKYRGKPADWMARQLNA